MFAPRPIWKSHSESLWPQTSMLGAALLGQGSRRSSRALGKEVPVPWQGEAKFPLLGKGDEAGRTAGVRGRGVAGEGVS